MGLFCKNDGGETLGYNCQQINDLSNVINNIAEQVGQCLVTRLNSDIIIPMSRFWCTKESAEFFGEFTRLIRISEKNITIAFDSFRYSIELSGTKWAKSTGGTIPKLSKINDIKLNVLNIKPQKNNNVIINEQQAFIMSVDLLKIKEEIKFDLKIFFDNLNARTAFVGYDQPAALKQCFTNVSNEIDKIFEYLIKSDQLLQNQIDDYNPKYMYASKSNFKK